jgi:hypothetical protein
MQQFRFTQLDAGSLLRHRRHGKRRDHRLP